MKSNTTDLASVFFLGDVSGAAIPGSRLHVILQRIDAHCPLTVIQQDFLRRSGYDALLQLALGELDTEAFRTNSQQEQEKRHGTKLAAEQREAEEQRRKDEATDQTNRVPFAKREEQIKSRRFRNQFGQGYIEKAHYLKVMQILRSVAEGNAIEDDDILWLGSEGSEYWTEELRKAHHTNMATALTEAWRRTGDVWQAINACAQWRKADRGIEGLTVADQALGRATDKKSRSATLTTRGGALRDLDRHDEAVGSGLEAHQLTPSDFRPCTLLGAVHMEIGDYSAGAEWYAKAEARGAPRDSVDREIQSILDAVSIEKCALMKLALKSLNADRYSRF